MNRDHDSYGALKEGFGADLRAAQARHRAKSRRPIRRRRVLAGAVAVGLAMTVGALSLSGAPAERLDVVARAEAALAPKPGIQHLRLKTYSDDRIDGKPMQYIDGQGPPEGPTLVERWSTAELGTFRSTMTEPARPGSPSTSFEDARRAGPTGKRDDVAKYYYERTKSMEIITRIPKGLRKYDTGGFKWGPNGDERLEDLREMLADGRLVDRGVAVIAGRPTRRLVGEKTYPDAPPLTFEYFVAADTFAPVRMVQVWRSRPESPSSTGKKGALLTTTNTVDFEVYEHLPATEANEQLLDFTPPPGTKITSRRYQENERDAAKRHQRDGFDPEEIAAGAGPTS